MTKQTKREHKKLMRRQRLAILAEIDELEKLRCEFCAGDNGYSLVNKAKCGCHSSIQISKLGNQLMKLVSERKQANIDPNKKPLNLDNLTFETMTPEIYKSMKFNGMIDKEILRIIRVGEPRLRNWKLENGIKLGNRKSDYDI